MVLVPLEHGLCPIQHTIQPLGQAGGDVPGGINDGVFLPGTVGLHVGFVHHVDSVAVAHVVPFGAVGVMGGAHSVDVVALEGSHGLFHIGKGDGPAGMGVPFVAVDAVEHQPVPVEVEYLVPQFKAAEAGVVGDKFGDLAIFIQNRQLHPVQLGASVIPQTDVVKGKLLADPIGAFFLQLQTAVKEHPVGAVEDFCPDSGAAFQQKPDVQAAAFVVGV